MPLIKCPDGLEEDLSLEQRKIDYRREAKKKSITPCGANRRQAK